MINVVLIEDQQLVREGIRTLLHLRPLCRVVAEASDGVQGLAAIEEHQPDVILLDIRMPNMSGTELLAELHQRRCNIPVLVLTTFDDHELVLECMRRGARGYLRKDVALDELLAAIETLHQGGQWVQPAVTRKVSEHRLELEFDSSSSLADEPLTAIELQVLRLVAAGYTNQEIAGALHKSTGTVRNQVSFILAKLNVRDRTRAVLKAIDNGLL